MREDIGKLPGRESKEEEEFRLEKKEKDTTGRCQAQDRHMEKAGK